MIHHRLLILSLGSFFLCSCEEFLPPRDDPRHIDASTVLRASIAIDGGVVFFAERDSTSSSTAGTAYLQVTNIHDEALSGLQNIDARVRYWLTQTLSDTVEASGDYNNLLNAYDYQGEVFMLDGNVLTILPDSTAILLVQWDHIPARFWEYARPRYVSEPCGFPPCDDYIITDPVEAAGQASIVLFASQFSCLETPPTFFTISYFFDVARISHVTYESFAASLDSVSPSIVNLNWVTSFQYAVYRFEVQRSGDPESGFSTIEGGVVQPRGAGPTVVSYDVTDRPGTGTWYYRIAISENFYPIGQFVVASNTSIMVDVP